MKRIKISAFTQCYEDVGGQAAYGYARSIENLQAHAVKFSNKTGINVQVEHSVTEFGARPHQSLRVSQLFLVFESEGDYAMAKLRSDEFDLVTSGIERFQVNSTEDDWHFTGWHCPRFSMLEPGYVRTDADWLHIDIK